MTMMPIGLSKFDPLSRILSYDDFDAGTCGYGQLIGNYEGSLDTMLSGYVPITMPMLSSLSHWEQGSHGSWDGTYALKLATRPNAGAVSCAIKRATFRKAGPIRLEFYFTFKPEAVSMELSETDVQSVGFLYDLQAGDRAGASGQRVMPHIRFLNAEDGRHVQKWQFKTGTPVVTNINKGDKTVSHFHLENKDWQDIPGGDQKLCYNEIPTKVNWHYACFDFDLETMKIMGFRCNDRVFDTSALDSIRLPAMKNLWCMLNLCFFVETAADKRAFMYLDSVCWSGDF
jgi:hypothetical protein